MQRVERTPNPLTLDAKVFFPSLLDLEHFLWSLTTPLVLFILCLSNLISVEWGLLSEPR